MGLGKPRSHSLHRPPCCGSLVRLELIGTLTSSCSPVPNASHVQSFAKRCSRQLLFLGPANLNCLAPLLHSPQPPTSAFLKTSNDTQLETRDITDRDRQ